MISIAKKKLMTIAEVLHRRIFGHEMSDEMRTFLGHLSWSFFGGITAGVIFLFINIIVGRVLGPTEYGKYSYVMVIGQLFIVPIMLGIDVASLKYLTCDKNIKEKKETISSSLFIFLISSTVVIFFILYFLKFWVNIFSTNKTVVIIALIYAILLGLRTLFDSFIRGLEFFKKQAVYRFIESLITLGAIVVCIYIFRSSSFIYYIISPIFGFIFIYVAYAFFLRNYIGKQSKEKILEIMHYSKYALAISAIGIFINQADKIAVNKTMGASFLGIYSAYYISSIALTSQITALFSTVLLPTIAKIKNGDSVVKIFNKFAIILSIPYFLFILIAQRIILFLFGNKYPIDYFLIFLFAILGVFNFINYFYSSFAMMHSRKMIKISTILFISRALIIVFLFWICYITKYMNLHVVVLILIFNCILELVTLKKFIGSHAN